MRRLVLGIISIGIILGVSFVCFSKTTRSFANKEAKKNFILILTDDQRWDTLWAMPILQEKLIKKGVNFTNAFVTVPLCCPDRASILSNGFYPYNTGVLTNEPPNGGVRNFNDANTLAIILQEVGYRSALIGKYLNGYAGISPYVPPGWDKWVAGVEFNDWMNFSVAVGSSKRQSSYGLTKNIKQYITDYLRDEAIAFIKESGNEPFFLYFSTTAPHHPATPAPGDEKLFSDYLFRARGWGEKDLSDKPQHIKKEAKKWNQAKEDEFQRNQLRSLQAVDRAIGAIVDAVEAKGLLNRTVFIFASDNGYLWGEHNLRAKNKPYEESIRVPMVVVVPGVPSGTKDDLVVSNLDIGPTILELAGISPKKSDGKSLVPLLKNSKDVFRPYLLIEGYGVKNWSGIRTREWKYIEHTTEEKEFYNLVNDPYELESRHNADINSLEHKKIMELADILEDLKGLTIASRKVPEGQVGVAYSFQVTAWGGKKPYSWSIVEGKMPNGLLLDKDTGLIQGVPKEAGESRFSLKVTSKALATHRQKPQEYIARFTIQITKKP